MSHGSFLPAVVGISIFSFFQAVATIMRSQHHPEPPAPPLPPIVAEKPVVACPNGGGQWIHVPNDGARWTLVCKGAP
jgi:hypothetical protein